MASGSAVNEEGESSATATLLTLNDDHDVGTWGDAANPERRLLGLETLGLDAQAPPPPEWESPEAALAPRAALVMQPSDLAPASVASQEIRARAAEELRTKLANPEASQWLLEWQLGRSNRRRRSHLKGLVDAAGNLRRPPSPKEAETQTTGRRCRPAFGASRPLSWHLQHADQAGAALAAPAPAPALTAATAELCAAGEGQGGRVHHPSSQPPPPPPITHQDGGKLPFLDRAHHRRQLTQARRLAVPALRRPAVHAPTTDPSAASPHSARADLGCCGAAAAAAAANVPRPGADPHHSTSDSVGSAAPAGGSQSARTVLVRERGTLRRRRSASPPAAPPPNCSPPAPLLPAPSPSPPSDSAPTPPPHRRQRRLGRKERSGRAPGGGSGSKSGVTASSAVAGGAAANGAAANGAAAACAATAPRAIVAGARSAASPPAAHGGEAGAPAAKEPTHFPMLAGRVPHAAAFLGVLSTAAAAPVAASPVGGGGAAADNGQRPSAGSEWSLRPTGGCVCVPLPKATAAPALPGRGVGGSLATAGTGTAAGSSGCPPVEMALAGQAVLSAQAAPVGRYRPLPPCPPPPLDHARDGRADGRPGLSIAAHMRMALVPPSHATPSLVPMGPACHSVALFERLPVLRPRPLTPPSPPPGSPEPGSPEDVSHSLRSADTVACTTRDDCGGGGCSAAHASGRLEDAG